MYKKALKSTLALALVAGLAACPGQDDEWETDPATETPATAPADPTWDDPMMDDTVIMDDTLRAEDDLDEDTATEY